MQMYQATVDSHLIGEKKIPGWAIPAQNPKCTNKHQADDFH